MHGCLTVLNSCLQSSSDLLTVTIFVIVTVQQIIVVVSRLAHRVSKGRIRNVCRSLHIFCCETQIVVQDIRHFSFNIRSAVIGVTPGHVDHIICAVYIDHTPGM